MKTKKLKSILKNYTHLKHVRRHLKQPQLSAVMIDEDTRALQAAKQLHAAVYLQRGFITHDALATDGTISQAADPHQTHSRYFSATYNGSVQALARQIECKPELGYESFPVLAQAQIHEASLQRIKSVGPDQCVEISALVKQPEAPIVAPFLLYRAMLAHSLASGHKFWIMALDLRVHQHLVHLFGPTFEQIGEATPYPGADIVPVMLETETAMARAREHVNQGSLPQRLIRREVFRLFEHDASFEYEMQPPSTETGEGR